MYENLIKLALLRNEYISNTKNNDQQNENNEKISDDVGEEHNDEYFEQKGEELLRRELISFCKGKPSILIKKSKYFHFIASRCCKNSYKKCKVPPSFWKSILHMRDRTVV